jgi:predicted membrane GTPase involved in stress response
VRKIVGEEPPDYLALAHEQEAFAAVHRTEAERTQSQAQALEDSAQAREAQAAEKQGEADTLHRLTPPARFDLEQAIEFIDDELVEVTPKSIHLRKKLLKEHERKRAGRAVSGA